MKKVGWIIVQGQECGFLLDLESLEEPRKGNLPSHWKNLVETEFIWNRLKQGEFSSVFRNQYLPSTKSCPKMSDTPVAYQKGQKEDIKWMYNLERNHTFEIREGIHPQAIHFFDTGYCFTNFQRQLTKAYYTQGLLEIPGGLLNSQMGNGKTASIIGLINSHKTSHDQSLIIASENIVFQWRQEFEKFAPNLRVLVVAVLSDWEKVAFESSNKAIIKDYDVILTHRKMFEAKEKLASEIFNVNFKRVVLDDIHEILVRYNKRQELFEEMRFAQIQYLNQQENDLSISNNKTQNEFLQIIKNLQKKFLWGVSSACGPARTAQAFQGLLSLDLSPYSPEKSDEANKLFLELHFRKHSLDDEVKYAEIEKSVIKVQPYSIHNFYLNPASAKDLSDQEMIDKVTQSQLAEFIAPDNENNCVSEALEIIHYKQQSDIRKIQAEISKNQKDSPLALNERIEALKGPNSFYAEAAQLLQSSQFECSVCLENHPIEKITMLSCLHHSCEGCYTQFSEEADISRCPICTKFINTQDLIMHPLYRRSGENKFTFLLSEIQRTSPEDKIVIFAQYYSVLGALAQSLKDFGFHSSILKGDCAETFKALEKFKANPDVKILLMTVKQGKSGINIPEANHVFFVQPLFEANRKKAALVYSQCVSRVIRMGQNKKVNVKLFLTNAFEDHVEDIFMEPWN